MIRQSETRRGLLATAPVLRIEIGANCVREYIACAVVDGLFLRAMVTMPESGHTPSDKAEAVALFKAVTC